MEFFNLEPFGWEAECFGHGIVAATIANVNRDTKKKRTPFEAIDFVPGAKREPKKLGPKELKARLQAAFAGAHGRNHNVLNQGGKGDGKSPKATRPQARVKGRRPRTKGGGKADSGRSQEIGSSTERETTQFDNGSDK